jgi:hypothetical protein
MGIDVSLWRQRIGSYIWRGFSRNSLQASASISLKCSLFISILLLIAGVEPNPGPKTGNTTPDAGLGNRSSVDNIPDALAKILSELSSLRSDQARLSDKLDNFSTSIGTRLQNLEDASVRHEAAISSLESDIKALQSCNVQSATTTASSTVSSGSSSSPSASNSSLAVSPHVDMANLSAELHARASKRLNVVFSGLPKFKDQPTDSSAVTELLRELKVSNIVPVSFHRVSSTSSLLIVCLQSSADKSAILRNAKLLRTSHHPVYAKVFVNPDRTALERQEQKKLVDEVRTRKAAGEDVIINRGRVILRPAQSSHSASSSQ